MLNTVKLLLPALVPSWRFFSAIGPSPRIEFVTLQTAEATSKHWREFRPRPERLTLVSMLKRMVWNPRWNETLFMVSCAERIIENPTEHSAQEIVRRIRTAIPPAPYLQFRLVCVSRQGEELQKEIVFTSSVYPWVAI